MVIAVEPIAEIPAKQLHVRIEDTVLVTDGLTLKAWSARTGLIAPAW